MQAGFNSARRKKAKQRTQNKLTNRMHNYQKNTNLFGNFPKRHIPPQTDGMIRFYSNLILLNPK